MKSIKQIAASVLLTLSVFVAVLYVSCSKDACKGVTCINGGTCNGGSCNCKDDGIGGANCELIYREIYSGTYKGMVNASGKLDSLHTIDSNANNNTLVFRAGTDTAHYDNMNLSWNDSTGRLILDMPIVLKNNSSTGSDFTVPSVNSDTFTYIGYGNVSRVGATLNLTRTHAHGSSVMVFSFTNFSRL